ncbi:D-3-phosphoglycerate dehydrogenase [Ectocarpus siliculosus]|uniref:D-3-phosphoglycerate dehydrogenase n=1 Tax=Ectocarpus siliculosus TaxID=2880 RepID=D7FJJ0_ECTSI|nr:D-3-phosphoglycerate dehydrogenase [Ectocarpus siliculosus]|eukprot:CBJ29093.1 D-3-phosphoglycerate dehydrogenase [Ectocarpus siliculosus]
MFFKIKSHTFGFLFVSPPFQPPSTILLCVTYPSSEHAGIVLSCGRLRLFRDLQRERRESSPMSLSKLGLAGRRAFHAAAPRAARILCLDNIDPVCVDIFQERGHHADVKNKLSVEQLHGIIGNYDGMVIRSATKATPDLLAKATNMKVIGRAGVGIDNIDVAEATRKGVLVMNTPGGNTVSTAQLAISLLCSAARRIPEADISMKAGKWERKKFMGQELKGKTIAIVGCGRIGQMVAKWAQGFDMEVIGFDPALPKDAAAELGIQLMDLPDVWAKADFITLHTPLTPDTQDLVNDESIAQMKDGVIIVNCARGGIINEDALLKALNSGKVASAALDVYSSEPPPESSRELLQHPRLVCTPHLGASTEEAQVNVARDVAVQMCDTLEGKAYTGVVNVSYMAVANEPAMQPYMILAERIGKMQAQISSSKVVKVGLRTYGGKAANIEANSARQVILATVMKGLLQYTKECKTAPSLINSPFLSKEMGIETSIDDKIHAVLVNSPYTNVITVDITLEDGETHSISGSVFGEEPNLVQIDNHRSFPAFKPEGTIVMFRNEDRAGVVLQVLQELEAAEVNVGRLNVGRQEGELALTIMGIDGEITPDVMSKLGALSAVREVSVANLSA